MIKNLKIREAKNDDSQFKACASLEKDDEDEGFDFSACKKTKGRKNKKKKKQKVTTIHLDEYQPFAAARDTGLIEGFGRRGGRGRGRGGRGRGGRGRGRGRGFGGRGRGFGNRGGFGDGDDYQNNNFSQAFQEDQDQAGQTFPESFQQNDLQDQNQDGNFQGQNQDGNFQGQNQDGQDYAAPSATENF